MTTRILMGVRLKSGIPVPPSRRVAPGIATKPRELTSPRSLVLVGMRVGECLETEDFRDADLYRHRFSRLARYGRWTDRQLLSEDGKRLLWRIWRIE